MQDLVSFLQNAFICGFLSRFTLINNKSFTTEMNRRDILQTDGSRASVGVPYTQMSVFSHSVCHNMRYLLLVTLLGDSYPLIILDTFINIGKF